MSEVNEKGMIGLNTMKSHSKTLNSINVSRTMMQHYQLAMKIANLSTCHFPMGCIIVKGSRVLSIGYNTIRTHPKQNTYGAHCISIHAELSAILSSQCSIKGSTIYVARVNGRKTSKPCKACYDYMYEAEISKMVYYDGNQIVIEKVI